MKQIPPTYITCYLNLPGEQEGVDNRRATDPAWLLTMYRIERSVAKPKEPIFYYLLDVPHRGRIREELLVFPSETQLPPSNN